MLHLNTMSFYVSDFSIFRFGFWGCFVEPVSSVDIRRGVHSGKHLRNVK